MPNNSSTRREKDKKKKDKKKKDNKKTDTPPLLKEDTASADSHSLSLSGEQKWEQKFFSALGKMEKDIQEHAAGEIDWEKADWAWARIDLLVQFHSGTTIAERTVMRRKFREEAEEANQLVSRAELKTQLDVAMLRKALEWRSVST